MKIVSLLVVVMATACLAQRSPYVKRPIGYPEVVNTLPPDEGLGNRFGEEDISTTTIRLPIEALGDADLVKRLLKLPTDKQPFWLLNWRALEANRQNPQTHITRPNSFLPNSIPVK